MERFRKYMGREVNLENVKNDSRLGAFGVACAYLPDPLEDFDEIEFRTNFGGQGNIVVTVTLETGKIKRVMFSEADEKNPDVIRSLTESRLAEFLAGKGAQLAGFFDYITA
ncbi:MAG: hypothetical protein ACOY40_13245 [Bacillota bacterium]